jgi:hypothetical protein
MKEKEKCAMADKKTTKKEYFGMVKEVIEASEVENKEELVAFVEAQVTELDKRAEKAKERNEKKKAESDELTEKIFSKLTEEYQFVDDIVAQLEDVEGISKAKVVARLTKLFAAGRVNKDKIAPAEGGDKKVAYAICTE